MKKSLFFAAAAAVLTMASCVDNHEYFDGEQEVALQEANDNVLRFGTFMSQQGTTRAGKAGLMTNDKLKSAQGANGGGFGVFGYYTGKDTYGQYQHNTYTDAGGASTEDHYANFMYNQGVFYSTTKEASGGYITNWDYTPLKYWPNESSPTGAVDDQTKEAPSTEYTFAGNVSFFAYAPFVDWSDMDTDEKRKNGITAINDDYTKGGNAKDGDPIITYTIWNPEPNEANNKFVDLLWGVMDGTAKENVVGDATLGTTSTATVNNYYYEGDNMYDESKVAYDKAVLYDGATKYTVNTDLSKQKTTGYVGFAFKHALAILGGSSDETEAAAGDDEEWGFRVILDTDDDKGAITGGDKGNETVVTIKRIILQAKSFAWEDKNGDDEIDDDEKLYIKANAAKLNLATGRWNFDYAPASAGVKAMGKSITPATPFEQKQTIETEGANFKLNKTLAEPNTPVTKVQTGSTPDPYNAFLNDDTNLTGVLTKRAKNVYDNVSDPLIFFPGTYPEVTVQVDYIVRTKDDNLKDGYSEVEQIIKKRLTFGKPVDINKKYDLLMHLGLTDVKFTATVDTWKQPTGTGETINDETGTPVTLVVENIHLPKNVGEYAFEATTTTINIDSDVTDVSFNLSGLNNSTAYTFDGSGKDKVTSPTLSAYTYTTGATESSKVVTLSNLGKNEGTMNKTYTVTITNGSTTKIFNIVQAPAPLIVNVSPSIIAGTNSVINPTFTVTNKYGTSVTDATYSIATKASGWTPTIASNGSSMTLSTNYTGSARVATITVTKDQAVGTVQITQNSATAP